MTEGIYECPNCDKEQDPNDFYKDFFAIASKDSTYPITSWNELNQPPGDAISEAAEAVASGANADALCAACYFEVWEKAHQIVNEEE